MVVGDDHMKVLFVEAGALTALSKLLACDNAEVVSSSLQLVLSLAECEEVRADLVQGGYLKYLAFATHAGQPEYVRKSAFAILAAMGYEEQPESPTSSAPNYNLPMAGKKLGEL